ncbi:DNA alkylation repair protein [Chitinophaga vietnamensis]|uniref:DNA alkylation repair protein n=1 Tax=Chitinophaga vietnamensis TaxID=2593957 RepID=UPI0011775CBC|nr:DNA alkylation repair protein [Chitinophaga vietnamensis]
MDYLGLITSTFEKAAHPADAVAMTQYLKNQFAHLGIKTPARRQMISEMMKAHGYPPIAEMPALINALWMLPEREYQYAAIDIMQKMPKQWTAAHIELFEWMMVHKSWWETVDNTISYLVAPLLKRFPALQPATTDQWIKSNDMWLQRAAITFQNGYKKDTDEALLFRYILHCSGSKEFFIQKAIGWSLREYAKTSPEAVKRFVGAHPLAALSVREALRRL